MKTDYEGPGTSRRRVLQCMGWGSAGILWTLTGGVPRALALGPQALAQASQLSFVQISDTHIGFSKDPNPVPDSTLREALAKITAMDEKPAFLLHTGDVSHLSKASEFDTANQIMKTTGLDTFYVPGEHDTIGDDGKLFFERFGRGNTGGWYSFDQAGVHFIGLVNVLHLKSGGGGFLGQDQLEWLENDVRDVLPQRRSSCSVICPFGLSIPIGVGAQTIRRRPFPI